MKHAGRNFMSGTFWVFVAEALIFPTGLITAGILTRRLGPEGYGLLTLVAVLVSWVEWTITSIFSRTAVKFVSDADDWQPVATVILQLHLGLGAIATAFFWVFAWPIADLLDIPTLVPYLRLFALDIPIFCLAYAHRQLLIGRGLFQVRAVASGGRWIARLAIIAALVEYAGWSINGAIIGSLGASVVELIMARWFVRPPLLSQSSFPPQRLFGYALPLFLFAMSLRLFDKLDLFMLKILGGTVAQAGVYGAAQNLAFVPGIFALSFSPLLLSTLNSSLRAGDLLQAKQMGANSVRTVVALIPFAALAAAASVPIVSVVYGQAFERAGPVLAVLIFAAMALMMVSVVTAILTAAGRPKLTAILVAPMLPLSVLGYVLFVPSFGAMGACWVNLVASVFGAAAAMVALYKIWAIAPPLMTFVRGAIASILIYAIGVKWITPDPSFLWKLLALCLVIPVILLCLGELSKAERAFISGWLLQQKWISALKK
ncbi:MAG: Membrane protein involved in the export of O-antigen and teichoic acid [Phormidesmis priestleyi Ana]|uniref:Membrane protein involved in the export of O-antigen and teichoic acid n=1 Tax=Phormidesmis priestleyi Ana TaxID=1666911 RepID=A0A0N8KNS6_9CYAN|nr:MAG: Membrane protein involved in the export of O-antigen and teichoic acid [Phormidesmis priestleyi Ana]